MRVYHRYLGFFLAGIMSIYAVSGIVLIFRNTDFLKVEVVIEKEIESNLTAEEIGKTLRIRNFKITRERTDTLYFEQGFYHSNSGLAVYSKKELPFIMDKMVHLHKATSDSPLFFMNIFFGVSLFFFVLSSFWMFFPGTKVFKKGMYFALAGIVLTILMVFI